MTMPGVTLKRAGTMPISIFDSHTVDMQNCQSATLSLQWPAKDHALR